MGNKFCGSFDNPANFLLYVRKNDIEEIQIFFNMMPYDANWIKQYMKTHYKGKRFCIATGDWAKEFVSEGSWAKRNAVADSVGFPYDLLPDPNGIHVFPFVTKRDGDKSFLFWDDREEPLTEDES